MKLYRGVALSQGSIKMSAFGTQRSGLCRGVSSHQGGGGGGFHCILLRSNFLNCKPSSLYKNNSSLGKIKFDVCVLGHAANQIALTKINHKKILAVSD